MMSPSPSVSTRTARPRPIKLLIPNRLEKAVGDAERRGGGYHENTHVRNGQSVWISFSLLPNSPQRYPLFFVRPPISSVATLRVVSTTIARRGSLARRTDTTRLRDLAHIVPVFERVCLPGEVQLSRKR